MLGLRAQFSARELGFNRTALYRIVPREQVADTNDFVFAWKQRRAELLVHWKEEPQPREFWEERELFEKRKKASYPEPDRLSDEQFCELCQELLLWWERENEKRRRMRPAISGLPRSVLGLRPSESYEDPDDAPRIAIIINEQRLVIDPPIPRWVTLSESLSSDFEFRVSSLDMEELDFRYHE